MTGTSTKRLGVTAADLSQAAEILGKGGLVAFPTETVYGLGADARDGAAVARIYATKGRPSFNPLIVHVASATAAGAVAVLDARAARLAEAFWPGPLSLVLPMTSGAGVSPLVTAGLETVAVRVPGHPVAQALLAAFGGPVAAPSANLSGKVSPTRADHVLLGLEGRIDAVVDGGDCAVGVESTILACLPGAPVQLLRDGGVARRDIEAVLRETLEVPETRAHAPNAPGQLVSHYAPKGRVRLNAQAAEAHETLLGFGPVKADLNLSERGDLAEAAARLFACLHALDAMGARDIAVSPIPETGLGRAINDRLRRAAAPRDEDG